jgi:hypothetical protein
MTVNEDHVPSGVELQVLNTFKNERETRDSSRMTPALIRRRAANEVVNGPTGDTDDAPSKQSVNFALNKLTAAGWVVKVDDGLYEFVTDPRQK